MRIKFCLILIFLILFNFKLACRVQALTLPEVNNIIGGTISYSGDNSKIVINNPEGGLYEIKYNAETFQCMPGSAGCEPDRYEIVIPEIVNPIYGLGMQAEVNQVEVDDFLDSSFSFGHYAGVKKDGTVFDRWAEGAYRLRTPILILPGKKMIIAYLQPEVKILRLSRNAQSGCPSNNTCIVMKKNNNYSEGKPGELVVIKGNSLDNTYALLRKYLQNKGNYFKDPNFRAFGVNWETYGELECSAEKTNILAALKNYEDKGVRWSTMTIGSGYWEVPGLPGNPGSVPGCSGGETGLPATDSLKVNDSRYGGLPGINNFFTDLINNHDIYPLIGMRQRIQPGNLSYDNIGRIVNLFQQEGYQKNIFIASPTVSKVPAYVSNGGFHYLLNTYDEENTNTWINLLKKNYGGFKGIKHDDMTISDQIGLYNSGINPTMVMPTTNLKDDYSTKIFRRYNDNFLGDFVLFTNNDWFSQGSDGEETDWVGNSLNYYDYQLYRFKYYTDLALTRTLSGYTNTMNYVDLGFGYKSGADITNTEYTKALTRITQLITFYPVSLYSAGFWHLKKSDGSDDTDKQSVAVFYMKLRQRLQQYAFDQAKKTFETGVPFAMRPLVFDSPSDNEVYKQYSYLDTVDDSGNPRDEYMFGNALLVRPVFNNKDIQKVYFPMGNWKPFISQASTRNKTYTQGYYDYPLPGFNGGVDQFDYPVFLKEGELLILGDTNDPTNLMAYVFFASLTRSSEYTLHFRDGSNVKMVAEVSGTKTYLKNLTNGQMAEMRDDPYGKGFRILEINKIFGMPTPTPTFTPTPTPVTTYKIGWNGINTAGFAESNLGTNCNKYTILKGFWESRVVGYRTPITLPLFSGRIYVECK